MNVLSLFDGMSCGQIALNEMGVTVDNYYASELDKFAIKESQENWPDMVHLGDVTKWRDWDIDWKSIDLLIGGSPCQGFSFAGKQLAFDDPRSALFFVYVDILNHIKSINPQVKFMLENVKMKKEYLQVITDQLGVEPVFINSNLVSAQNRQRYYWCNWEVKQPEDRGIMLADILEHEPTDPTFMSDKFVKRQHGRKCLVDDVNKKASSLSAMEYVKNGRQGDYINAAAMVGRKINPATGKREDNNKDLKTIQTLEVHDHGKARCVSTVSKDCLISSLPPGRYQNVKIREKSKCVRSSGRGSYDRHEWDSISNCHYRKLTVIECCRLQGAPDDYFKVSSNTQAYKMLGNGWQIDTIKHIFSTMGEIKREKQLKLFKADNNDS